MSNEKKSGIKNFNMNPRKVFAALFTGMVICGAGSYINKHFYARGEVYRVVTVDKFNGDSSEYSYDKVCYLDRIFEKDDYREWMYRPIIYSILDPYGMYITEDNCLTKDEFSKIDTPENQICIVDFTYSNYMDVIDNFVECDDKTFLEHRWGRYNRSRGTHNRSR